ncbi:hypothetical protein RB597_009465 [Gaeumannomyces tritici]
MDSSNSGRNSPTPSHSTAAADMAGSRLPAEDDGGSNSSSSSAAAEGLIVFSHELPGGDSVQDLLRRLHRHAKRPRHGLLARFLRECVAVLRHEAQALPRDERAPAPPFGDVAALGSCWEALRRGPVGGAWEGAMVCLYHLAVLIGHHEATDQPYHSQDSAPPCLVGVSIGLFSAAAVAVSPTLTDLVSCGAEAVRMAFVFCRHVGRVSQLLETAIPTTPGRSPSWASVIIGLPADVVQAELDLFNNGAEQQAGRQDDDDDGGMATALTRVSISHVDHGSVGVTGTPSRLAELFAKSKPLGASRHAALPISGGLCHVPHVYGDDDVRAVLRAARVGERWGRGNRRRVVRPLLSPHTGSPFEAADAAGLIEEICAEALTKPLFFDKVAEGAAAQTLRSLDERELAAAGTQPSRLGVLHYRTSVVSDGIVSAVEGRLLSSRAVVMQRQDVVDWVVQQERGGEAGMGRDDLTGNPGSPQDSKLAVVGMACRMPGDADTPDKFWELLVQGRDTLAEVPPDRFDLDAHFDPAMKAENTVNTRFGNFVSGPGLFDAGFFNMSPREAQQTDPMQRLALVTAYEALEMAGFVPGRTASSHASRVGTYYGQASDDYREVNASQKIGTYGIPGTERAFGNGRINYFFNFQGPSFNVDTACSSGLAAVHAACSALWAGEVDTVVAGGLNVITSPDIYCMLGKGHFLSPTGQCKVWDAGADGYCRGDGVGSVVIKRLEDALADNDVVLATILAGATNHSSESVSITQPHAAIQKNNYQRVMDRAGVDPLDVSYVELHGTGTQVGDAVESESVLDFFAPDHSRQGQDQHLALGALKCNIGHGEAAAGIASLIKVLLMYRHGVIPRHIGIKTAVNPVVARHLAGRNAGVAFENKPWTAPDGGDGKRYSIVNSFGAHGGNTTLLLEDAAPPAASLHHQGGDGDNGDGDDGRHEVVCISAKSKASLRGNVAALLGYLDANPDARLRDVAYTTSARRMHHHIRVAEAVSSTARLGDVLRAMVADDAVLDAHACHVARQGRKKVVFAFSGQGCFYRGAAAALCERSPDFARLVLELDSVLVRLGFPSVRAAVVENKTDGSLVESDVGGSDLSPLVAQLALVVLQIALARYWALLGITPDAVVGHSLGEYAALCAAGVLSAADALFLVGRRAQLTAARARGGAGSHAMLSVRGVSAAQLAEMYPPERFGYEVSCLNGRADTVVSGPRDALVALRDAALLEEKKAAMGLKCVLLDVPYAFHSAQMDPVLADFEAAARRRVTFKRPQVPVISPLLGRCVLPSEAHVINETYLRRAARERVDFVSAVAAAAAAGLADDGSVWLDIGPHPVCSTFVRNCRQEQKEEPAAATALPSLRRGDDSLAAWSSTLAALHRLGLPVAWDEYFSRRGHGECSKAPRLLHLATYCWNNKNYWIPYEGTWTLDKADPAAAAELHRQRASRRQIAGEVPFLTSSVQRVAFEDVGEKTARLTAISDLRHPHLLGAATGHKIHGRSVLTASIWADICLTVGEHAYKRLVPNATGVLMDVRDMRVVAAQLIAEEEENDGDPAASPPAQQLIRIEAGLDLSLGRTNVGLWTCRADGSRDPADRAFATAVVWYYPDDGSAAMARQDWAAEWRTAAHLVGSRIDALWDSTTAAATGSGEAGGGASTSTSSALSNRATYELFANIVDYGPQYRAMRRVALDPDALEAAADVTLDDDRHGDWRTPPHWIDGAFQLAGLVMNSFGDPAAGSPARDFFFITPGWRRLRLLEPLRGGVGAGYRNYVRMVPEAGGASYVGDIYLLRGKTVVGLCEGIEFKRVPRALMAVMFPRRGGQRGGGGAKSSNGGGIRNHPLPTTINHGAGTAAAGGHAPSSKAAPPIEAATPIAAGKAETESIIVTPPSSTASDGVTGAEENQHQHPHVAASMRLIARETGLDAEDMRPETAFADVGVDSLMSLTLADKLQAELGVPVKASLFLECATVADLERWLIKVGTHA